MYVFSGGNPTTLYKETFDKLMDEGDELAPRGKKIKELRPVSIEFKNPLMRMTFLGGRRINPFFQLAESFQIVSGINDAKWLSMFNANMINFSDDKSTYNAFYGTRIRHWGDGPSQDLQTDGAYGEGALDQLYDVYKRILEDKDTRQAMIAIGNPTFDNYHYLNKLNGLDVACLPGDAMVSTGNGNVPISDINPGNYVYTINTDTGNIELKQVLNSGKTKLNAELLKISLENGSYIECTHDHLVFVFNGGKIATKRADEMDINDDVVIIEV